MVASRRRCATAQLGFALVGLVLTAIARPVHGAAPTAASFSYFYIEANEGSSAGGHVAIRFDDQVYHFQNQRGLLVLERVRTDAFVHAYTLLANREIHASRVEVDADDQRTLRAAFDRRLYAQRRQLATLASLDADRSLLERWKRTQGAAGSPADASPRIPGLGYFEPLDAPIGAPSPVAAGLLADIERHYGPTFVAGRRRAQVERLDALTRTDPADWNAGPPRARDEAPAFATGWADRYEAAAGGLAALEVLVRGARLRDDAVVVPPGLDYLLTPEEGGRLHAASADLAAQLVRLASSPRHDWGLAFLAGLARLEAMHASLEQGRWVLVDAMPDEGRRIPARVMASHEGLTREIIAAGHADASTARRLWAADPDPPERAWTRIEDTVNRVHELERSLAEERDMRWSRDVLTPARRAPLPVRLPRLDDERALDASIDRVRSRRERYERALSDLHGYRLLSRNCVSEVFTTLNDALGGSAQAATLALGGHVDGRSQLRFIPFVSAAAVDDTYRVTARRVLPSQRDQDLARMREHENDLKVTLRESNTFTAHSYRRGQVDSFFIFFTEDAGALRPPLGAMNLAAGVGETLWGVPRLPIDRGHTLVSGLRGSLMSLPELFFFNIRKGSNDWVDPNADRRVAR